MVRRVLVGAFIALIAASAVACSSAELEEDDLVVDEGALTSSELGSRGERQAHFAVPGRPDELCIVSKKNAGGVYLETDKAAEASLCSLAFDTSSKGVATCPNASSHINPRVELHALADRNCALVAEKVATFEQSVTCSYTGAILGYYHLSRFLGGAGNVPPSVIRTMDLEAHKAIVARGVAATIKRDGAGFGLHDAWLQYRTMDASPREFARFSQVYTADAQQVYGALKSTVRNVLAHPFMRTARGDAGLHQFIQSATFTAVTSNQPLAGRFPATLGDKAAAQGIVLAKDASDMVLMDELMSQADRYGNVHSVAFKVFDDAGRLKKVRLTRDARTGVPVDRPEIEGAIVEELVLRDNECGVTKENRNAKADLVAKLAHMSARTYEHFMWFAKQVATVGSPVDTFMREEALLTPMDMEWLSRRATTLATTLKTRCDSGALALDADLQSHLRGTYRAREACSAAGRPQPASAQRDIELVEGGAPTTARP